MTRIFSLSRLRLAQLIWLVAAAFVLALYAAGLPVRLEDVADNLAMQMIGNQSQVPAISPQFIASYITTAESLYALALFSIGAFLFWRRHDEKPVLFFSGAMVLAAVFSTDFMMSLVRERPAWRLIIVARSLAYIGIVTTYYLFPDGRFVPRWTRPLAAIFALYALSWFFAPQIMFPSNHLVSTPREFLTLIWGVLWLFSGVVAQLIRYHRERDLAARQQTKWVLFGFATLATMALLTFIPPLLFTEFREPGRPLAIYILIAAPALMAGMAMVPLSIGFSVLRYGLWDIDTIVNKALVYGALSSVLVAIFFASVLLIQRGVDLVTGQTQGSLATVLSTLLIAGLFTPLRQRIQRNIDRRFYRRKYDAARTLERFSATVRDKVELDRLVVELVAVVQDTVQPEHVTLWLRPDSEGNSEPSLK